MPTLTEIQARVEAGLEADPPVVVPRGPFGDLWAKALEARGVTVIRPPENTREQLLRVWPGGDMH